MRAHVHVLTTLYIHVSFPDAISMEYSVRSRVSQLIQNQN